MKKIKVIICSAALMLALFSGCDNSVTSSGSISSNETEILEDKMLPQIYKTVIKLSSGERASFDNQNLPFKTFGNFKIRNVGSAENNICSDLSYTFYAINFSGNVYECIRGGEEIIRLDEGLYALDVDNMSGSVLKLEISIY